MENLQKLVKLVRETRELEKRFAGKRDANMMLKIQQNQNKIDMLLEKIPKPDSTSQQLIISDTTPAN
jgi:hypothetical protein